MHYPLPPQAELDDKERDMLQLEELTIQIRAVGQLCFVSTPDSDKEVNNVYNSLLSNVQSLSDVISEYDPVKGAHILWLGRGLTMAYMEVLHMDARSFDDDYVQGVQQSTIGILTNIIMLCKACITFDTKQRFQH